ncbi:MAG: ATP-binding protein [Pseudanabaena frigida]|uniref:ATP-binding protein n=1 Tax=Pseudanabaena frigida TaxID=945775 RepID=A0A2W4WGV5_9CYAN|nr:MAG: ATP-binding protein [Pseudanabaena frigida]
MHIEKLRMQNFRGFKDVTIDFPSNLAVFIGVNGSGKSSVLDCCALFLSILTTSIRTFRDLNNSEPPSLLEIDIKTGYNETHNQIDIAFNSKSFRLPFTLARKSAQEKSALTKLPTEGVPRFIFHNLNYAESNDALMKVTQEFHQILLEKFSSDPNHSLPIMIYYPTDRMVYETPLESDKEYLNHQLLAYDRAITKKVDFADFFTWYRNQEDLENEIRLDNDTNYIDHQLQTIRDATPSFLPQLSNLRVKRSSPIRMTMTKEGEEITVNQLSSGEKNLFAMIADIARRLALANPSLENALEGEGIILIDEIELHLHPQWQRDIIPRLTSTFPNCQFIVTTHSPQVLSNVKKENVFIVEDFQVYPADAYTFGRDSNSILSELMGVSERPIDVQNKLTECLYKIDDGQIEEAKILLHELSDLLGHNDSEIVKANTLISFLSKVK